MRQWHKRVEISEQKASLIADISVDRNIFNGKRAYLTSEPINHWARIDVLSASVTKKQTGTPLFVMGLRMTIVNRKESALLFFNDLHVLWVESMHHSTDSFSNLINKTC